MPHKTHDWQISCLVFFCLLPSGYGGVNGSFPNQFHDRNGDNIFGFEPKMLFIFGDSYVDTGNNPITFANSWRFPYGITFPNKPTGRYSDGRVSSYYLAKYLGLRSPIPYRWRRYEPKQLEYGMNFAYGGAGVFETIYKVANTTLQIENFRNLVHENVYSAADLLSSVALFSIAGNDYFTYLTLNNVTQQGIETFTRRIINQMILDITTVQNLGVRKVAIAAMQPLGCLPVASTATGKSGFRWCNETYNVIAKFHNTLLSQALIKLNQEKNDTVFIMLDIYKAFWTVLKNKGVRGISSFPNPLERCCVTTKKGYKCGEVDKRGVRTFELCKDPKSFFFWDDLHPSQQGWRSIYSVLLPDL
ncbi:PREDICTED: LOW QUALITY PROTEIN: GDSL esterase/lipase At2g36325-like [Tarenaya hassleriana]|uniref:LOW QUALITY PROTEIN: GDSL esterase/lipase At2g36325-like n=1 Tax=Tarenaya hassleriana TaxID=28532 RepID=UPI00053C1353|nr:PREDICTED: LOW QUALITY PROTEIN: GDSL esterase/lipase At2g36325-like [Tarenaya hassleriana]